jgi:hypothetical protein
MDQKDLSHLLFSRSQSPLFNMLLLQHLKMPQVSAKLMKLRSLLTVLSMLIWPNKLPGGFIIFKITGFAMNAFIQKPEKFAAVPFRTQNGPAARGPDLEI